MNDLEQRLTAAFTTVADQARIDPDAWRQNEERLRHHPHRSVRRYLVGSAIGLAAASLAILVAIAIWPHNSHTTPPAGPGITATPTPTITTPPQTASPSNTAPSGTVSGAAQNLTVTPAIRDELRTAYVTAKNAPPSQIAGPVAGSVYYGYLPATDTYWAVAMFTPSSTATLQTQVSMQDGGNRGVFHHQTGQPWQVVLGGIPWPCPGDLPDAIRTIWALPLAGCQTSTGVPPAAATIGVYANCTDPIAQQNPVVKPTTIDMACADNGFGIEALQWNSWTTNSAIGIGTTWYKDCQPNCAEGKIVYTPNVQVTLTQPVAGPYGNNVWSQITFTSLPPGYPAGPQPLPTHPS